VKHKKKILTSLLIMILAAIAAWLATPTTVSASRGPNKQHETTVTFSAEDLQLVTLADAVRMWNYPDGAHMGQVTFHWEDNPGSTWDMNSYSIWNVPYSSGGHTDTLVNSCRFNLVSPNACTGGAGDGGTRVDFGQDNLSDANTFWLRVRFSYGGTEYCRQVYVNNDGDTAVGFCTN